MCNYFLADDLYPAIQNGEDPKEVAREEGRSLSKAFDQTVLYQAGCPGGAFSPTSDVSILPESSAHSQECLCVGMCVCFLPYDLHIITGAHF